MSQQPPSWILGPELVDDELRERFASLTAKEFQAVRDALVYHFNYVRPDVTRMLDDDSMPARSHREQFQELHAGMSKLGIRVRSPLPKA